MEFCWTMLRWWDGESERKRARVATARGAARMHSARLYYCDAFTEMLMRGLYCIYYYTILTVSGGGGGGGCIASEPHISRSGLSLLKFPAPL